MVYLTRREQFNAAHKLWVDKWSKKKNQSTFGKCANPNWHGHNYTLYITVKGKPNKNTGFVMDAKKLSKLMRKYITSKLDHSNLNMDVDFIPKKLQPTTENLVILIWQQLEPHIKGCKLHSVRLHETDNIYAEYLGEEC
ncbi:MAG: 6-pyruvoyl tetrahydropterin synthase family protein [Saprospiraceae bacterium]